ncbi:MAG: glycosyltransferase, partial [Desulfosarcina sp.]|nr:glycosyltransferase [Desulfobacterales bacterium]
GNDKIKHFKKLAVREGVAERVYFLGGRNDIPELLAASDILLHPAYHENTGTVLIEALAAGLPVIVTEVCGYSFHIKNADAGKIIPSPFQQKTFNNILLSMLTSEKKRDWKNNGKKYIDSMDIFRMPEKIADIIEGLQPGKF